MNQRLEVVTFAGREGASIAEIARRYSVSRKTVYKWLRRHAAGEPLEDRSHRPHSSPARTPEAMEQAIIELRQRHPHWGSRKLRQLLLKEGLTEVPAPSTITRVLARAGLIDNNSATRPANARFEALAPNDLWQMDFKGPLRLPGGPVHALPVLDDHSRFALALAACPDQRGETVKRELIPVFRQYGLPWRLLVDNGPPWGSDREHPHTILTAWLLRLGIDVSHGRPYHPQTQGKVERFNGTLTVELLRDPRFMETDDPQLAFDRYRAIYNHERPHQALDLATPAERYTPSPRPYPETLPPIEYGPDDTVRKVQDGGWFSFHNGAFKVSAAFKGYPIALRPTLEDGEYAVHFCHKRIGTIRLVDRGLDHDR